LHDLLYCRLHKQAVERAEKSNGPLISLLKINEASDVIVVDRDRERRTEGPAVPNGAHDARGADELMRQSIQYYTGKYHQVVRTNAKYAGAVLGSCGEGF
jgi:hypothetical protein